MKSKIGIAWFRQDLRVEDNAALAAAVARSDQVVPVFVWDDEDQWSPGAASRWWLHDSLADLDRRLREKGSRLILRRGDTREAIKALIAETGAGAIYLNRRFEPAAAAKDKKLLSQLAFSGVEIQRFNDSLLLDPDEMRTTTGMPYRVFTPFWNQLLKTNLRPRNEPRAEGRLADQIAAPAVWPASVALDDLDPALRDDSTLGLAACWTPGETAANQTLDRFLGTAGDTYETDRDYPGIRGTSVLSPYLHFGNIAPRRVWHQTTQWAGYKLAPPYLRQLAWREFAYHLLHHFPESTDLPLRRSFDLFPWRDDEPSFRAWSAGRTGYPIVDAGMRELLRTGWMHNRVRMIAASFLVKDLLIDWRRGARWFWDKLVDADLANNTMGWQWVAGCGADAAPFFRVFNPVLQGRKFDPDGEYVRRWVPELRSVPTRHVHAPWAAPQPVLDQAGVALGTDYPHPIVDHAEARHRALAALYSITRGPASNRVTSRKGTAR